MKLTVNNLGTIQHWMFALQGVVEDIEATVSIALRELEMVENRHCHPNDVEIISFTKRVAEQIEIYSRVFTEIESSVSQTVDISTAIENELKELAE